MSKFIINAFADESSPELSGQIDAMLRNGVQGLEVRGVNGKNIGALTNDEVSEVTKALADNGLNTWSIGSAIGKIKITEDFPSHLDKCKRIIEIANMLDAKYVRLFSFYMVSDITFEDCRNEVLDRMSQFVEAAKGSGVLLCHENEKGIYGDIAPRCLDLHKELPELGCIFDPANYIQCGQDTLEAWDMLGDRVTYMHIKDALADGSVVPAGKGIGNLPELLKMYAANGGAGVTLEPHLTVFKGLQDLEQEGEKSIVGKYEFPSKEAAFDAAVGALKDIIKE